jgi:hypothetical protein
LLKKPVWDRSKGPRMRGTQKINLSAEFILGGIAQD